VRPPTAELDQYVCAELPDPATQPVLYDLVTRKMLHECSPERCGVAGCSRRYPMPFAAETTHGVADTKVTYRRRAQADGGYEYRRPRDNALFTNQHVVPYNPWLLLRYRCDLNVEACTSVGAIRYLFKYIFKGGDRLNVRLRRVGPGANAPTGEGASANADEVSCYLDTRYIGPHESVDLLMGLPTWGHTHVTYRLPVHLPGQQRVIHNGTRADAQRSLARNASTELTSFFQTCAQERLRRSTMRGGVARQMGRRYRTASICSTKTFQTTTRLIGQTVLGAAVPAVRLRRRPVSCLPRPDRASGSICACCWPTSVDLRPFVTSELCTAGCVRHSTKRVSN
jgi:hypothetical protein